MQITRLNLRLAVGFPDPVDFAKREAAHELSGKLGLNVQGFRKRHLAGGLDSAKDCLPGGFDPRTRRVDVGEHTRHAFEFLLEQPPRLGIATRPWASTSAS